MLKLITNGGTHDPHYYTSHILNEFVPMPPNATDEVASKVHAVRAYLRPHVEEAVAACRNHERAAWESFSDSDREQLVDLFRYQTSRPSQTLAPPALMHRYTNKVFAPDYWVDCCAQKIAKAVSECTGDKPNSNELMNRIYNVFTNWFGVVADVERQHSVSSRGL